MSKPDWCPQEVWCATKDAFDVLYENETDLEGGCEQGIREMCARAIMAAEKRGEERESEACALKVVDYLAEVTAANDEGRELLAKSGLATNETDRRGLLLTTISEDLSAAIRNRTAS